MRFSLFQGPPDDLWSWIKDEELARTAYIDGLTGLLNRSGLLLRIARALEREGGGTLFRCDLRRLKALNDTLGQDLGNALIQAAAGRLGGAGLSANAVARLGGGEFALFIERSMNAVEAAHEAEALISLFQTPLALPDDVRAASMPAEVAIGVASTSDERDDPEQLMMKAGRALQRAKTVPGGYHVHDVTSEEEIRIRRTLNDDLRRAVENGEWRLFYQPQVHLADGGLTGVEALLRWDHPRRGLMTPAQFLPALQRHVRAAHVGAWLLGEACRQLRDWRRDGFQVPRVAVNLFAIQFHDALEADIVEVLQRYDLGPQDLEIEITETIVLDSNGQAQDIMRSLARRGIAISLDDFGTGYASLATIKTCPVTRVKIDRSFVIDLDRSPHSVAIVRAIIAIGVQLGLEVVAEGVEQEWQRRTLVDLGCRHGQGYLFGRAVSADQLPRLMKRRKRS